MRALLPVRWDGGGSSVLLWQLLHGLGVFWCHGQTPQLTALCLPESVAKLSQNHPRNAGMSMVPRNPAMSMVFWNSKQGGFERSEQNPGMSMVVGHIQKVPSNAYFWEGLQTPRPSSLSD